MAIFSRASNDYFAAEKKLCRLFDVFPGELNDKVESLPLFISNYHFSRIIFLYECYKKIITVPGEIHLFGIRYGRGLATVDNIRGNLEPLNGSRLIVGYDTFDGIFKNGDQFDSQIEDGELSTERGYFDYLQEIVDVRNQLLPLSHIKQFDIEAGDAVKCLEERLRKNPATIIAMAHLDMNVFKATEDVLQLMKPHLVKGSILIFDEFGHPNIDGPTLAARSQLGQFLNIRRLEIGNTSWSAIYQVE